MATNPNRQRPTGRDSVFLLNAAIRTLHLAKEVSSITPAKVAFGVVSVLLTMIRVYYFVLFCDDEPQLMFFQDTVVKKHNYVDLGLACADVCKALDRGLNRRPGDQFNESVREAIEQLTT